MCTIDIGERERENPSEQRVIRDCHMRLAFCECVTDISSLSRLTGKVTLYFQLTVFILTLSNFFHLVWNLNLFFKHSFFPINFGDCFISRKNSYSTPLSNNMQYYRVREKEREEKLRDLQHNHNHHPERHFMGK